MARIKCLKCGKPMKKSFLLTPPSDKEQFRLYKCPACNWALSKLEQRCESPSAKRIRLGKEVRLADRWQKKMGGE